MSDNEQTPNCDEIEEEDYIDDEGRTCNNYNDSLYNLCMGSMSSSSGNEAVYAEDKCSVCNCGINNDNYNDEYGYGDCEQVAQYGNCDFSYMNCPTEPGLYVQATRVCNACQEAASGETLGNQDDTLGKTLGNPDESPPCNITNYNYRDDIYSFSCDEVVSNNMCSYSSQWCGYTMEYIKASDVCEGYIDNTTEETKRCDQITDSNFEDNYKTKCSSSIYSSPDEYLCNTRNDMEETYMECLDQNGDVKDTGKFVMDVSISSNNNNNNYKIVIKFQI